MASAGPRLWPALDLTFPGEPAADKTPNQSSTDAVVSVGPRLPPLREALRRTRHNLGGGGQPRARRVEAQGLPPEDLAVTILDDHSPTAIEEFTTPSLCLRAFFSTTAERDEAGKALRLALGPHGVVIGAIDVEDEDWAARSQADLRAVRAGDVVVSPPWDTTPAGERWRITIVPSMGFGTGHHQSTRLCLLGLQHLSLQYAFVIDVGTGSGVLAITAAVMGARRVVAIDHDADAIDAARDGLDRNGCADRVTLQQASLADLGDQPPADIVLANLTSAPLVRHAGQLTKLLAPGGAIIVSGFTTDEEARVQAAFADLSVERRDQEDDWCALTLRRSGT